MNQNLNTILLITNIIAQAPGAFIFSEIAEGLCGQYAQFLGTRKLPLRLERHSNSPAVPKSWLKWKSCDQFCSPFTIVQPNGLSTIKTKLQKKTRNQPSLSVIVELRSQPDCLGHEISTLLPIICDHGESNAGVVTKFLKNYAANAQAGVVNVLESKRRSLGLDFEPLWITNKIIVSGSDVATVKEMLGGHKDVKTVRLEEVMEIVRSPTKRRVFSKQSPPPIFPPEWFWGQIELNISAIHSAGINGTGIVVGGIDSGVDYTHPALFKNHRSEYGWFDPYFGDPFPIDEHGHGTHTMGIIAGEQPVGLAPGATWIACRSCLQTGCLEVAIIKCMQWMLCPTRPNGTDPNCSKKPRVVNNSWGTAEYHDGSPRELYNGIISCWRQAGIIPVFSVGNDGPHCSSLGYPGVLKEVLGVGMLSDLHGAPHVHDNSSRGPPAPHWNVTFKPDFIAPGDDIFSTLPDINSGWLTGTSQAAPHVTATIALMLEVNPALSFEDVRDALIGSARPTQVVNPQSCGGISENVYPNFQVGYGSINSYKAVFGTWP